MITLALAALMFVAGGLTTAWVLALAVVIRGGDQ